MASPRSVAVAAGCARGVRMSGRPGGVRMSGRPDVEVLEGLRKLARGLKTPLGVSPAAAFSRLRAAWGGLSAELGRAPAEDELVREVFRSRR